MSRITYGNPIELLNEMFAAANAVMPGMVITRGPVNKQPETKVEDELTLVDYIDHVIFQDPATIVFWNDGSKTVVKTTNGEAYDPEKGLAMAILKGAFGNRYFRDMNKIIKQNYVKLEVPVAEVTEKPAKKTTAKKSTKKTTASTTEKTEKKSTAKKTTKKSATVTE